MPSTAPAGPAATSGPRSRRLPAVRSQEARAQEPRAVDTPDDRRPALRTARIPVPAGGDFANAGPDCFWPDAAPPASR